MNSGTHSSGGRRAPHPRLGGGARARVAALGVMMMAALGTGEVRGQAPGLVDPDRVHMAFGPHVVLALPGELSLVYGTLSPIDIRAEDPAVPSSLPREHFGYARLRLQPSLVVAGADFAPFQVYRFAADIDVLRHVVPFGGGGPRDVLRYDPYARAEGGSLGAHLQALTLQATSRVVAIQLGLARSHWGLGLLANAGEGPRFDDDEASPFGFPLTADRVLRAQVAFFPIAPARADRPAPLTLAMAFDAVVDDDTARWSDGDRAYQGIAAVLGYARPVTAGLYAVYRRQRHHEGGETSVTVVDAHARVDIAQGDAVDAWLEGEAALILGSSSLMRSPLHSGSFDVASTGGVLRFGIRSGLFTGVMEAGAASGDDNPFDDKLRAFSFDREYRVGLLLFREVLRASTAVGAHNLADPDFRGQPPRGFERNATSGAVRGAAYVNPRVSLRAHPRLRVDAGFLYAASSGEYVDPFRSGLEGGAPVGPRGARAKHDLGWEVNLAARYEGRAAPFTFDARVEFAFYRPGGVFDDADGNPAADVAGIWLHLGGRW